MCSFYSKPIAPTGIRPEQLRRIKDKHTRTIKDKSTAITVFEDFFNFCMVVFQCFIIAVAIYLTALSIPIYIVKTLIE